MIRIGVPPTWHTQFLTSVELIPCYLRTYNHPVFWQTSQPPPAQCEQVFQSSEFNALPQTPLQRLPLGRSEH